ncbi:hypothetical protein, conserved [Babesia bigemina]|uniref:Uncharacterized protein n=1 Tax=Babesia bigemina TaxID=5866 RepID=A0A061DAL9_BABBI|nr:hypothetical protein, conserved [Babesia bigemina]CDR97598.1 hypothetical protein, conserved [Babesia bigemina]|eukprot:XP_012769784.1 hypothetical protein, conserved [Babesia bigemina]
MTTVVCVGIALTLSILNGPIGFTEAQFRGRTGYGGGADSISRTLSYDPTSYYGNSDATSAERETEMPVVLYPGTLRRYHESRKGKDLSESKDTRSTFGHSSSLPDYKASYGMKSSKRVTFDDSYNGTSNGYGNGGDYAYPNGIGSVHQPYIAPPTNFSTDEFNQNAGGVPSPAEAMVVNLPDAMLKQAQDTLHPNDYASSSTAFATQPATTQPVVVLPISNDSTGDTSKQNQAANTSLNIANPSGAALQYGQAGYIGNNVAYTGNAGAENRSELGLNFRGLKYDESGKPHFRLTVSCENCDINQDTGAPPNDEPVEDENTKGVHHSHHKHHHGGHHSHHHTHNDEKKDEDAASGEDASGKESTKDEPEKNDDTTSPDSEEPSETVEEKKSEAPPEKPPKAEKRKGNVFTKIVNHFKSKSKSKTDTETKPSDAEEETANEDGESSFIQMESSVKDPNAIKAVEDSTSINGEAADNAVKTTDATILGGVKGATMASVENPTGDVVADSNRMMVFAASQFLRDSVRFPSLFAREKDVTVADENPFAKLLRPFGDGTFYWFKSTKSVDSNDGCTIAGKVDSVLATESATNFRKSVSEEIVALPAPPSSEKDSHPTSEVDQKSTKQDPCKLTETGTDAEILTTSHSFLESSAEVEKKASKTNPVFSFFKKIGSTIRGWFKSSAPSGTEAVTDPDSNDVTPWFVEVQNGFRRLGRSIRKPFEKKTKTEKVSLLQTGAEVTGASERKNERQGLFTRIWGNIVDFFKPPRVTPPKRAEEVQDIPKFDAKSYFKAMEDLEKKAKKPNYSFLDTDSEAQYVVYDFGKEKDDTFYTNQDASKTDFVEAGSADSGYELTGVTYEPTDSDSAFVANRPYGTLEEALPSDSDQDTTLERSNEGDEYSSYNGLKGSTGEEQTHNITSPVYSKMCSNGAPNSVLQNSLESRGFKTRQNCVNGYLGRDCVKSKKTFDKCAPSAEDESLKKRKRRVFLNFIDKIVDNIENLLTTNSTPVSDEKTVDCSNESAAVDGPQDSTVSNDGNPIETSAETTAGTKVEELANFPDEADYEGTMKAMRLIGNVNDSVHSIVDGDTSKLLDGDRTNAENTLYYMPIRGNESSATSATEPSQAESEEALLSASDVNGDEPTEPELPRPEDTESIVSAGESPEYPIYTSDVESNSEKPSEISSESTSENGTPDPAVSPSDDGTVAKTDVDGTVGKVDVDGTVGKMDVGSHDGTLSEPAVNDAASKGTTGDATVDNVTNITDAPTSDATADVQVEPKSVDKVETIEITSQPATPTENKGITDETKSGDVATKSAADTGTVTANVTQSPMLVIVNANAGSGVVQKPSKLSVSEETEIPKLLRQLATDAVNQLKKSSDATPEDAETSSVSSALRGGSTLNMADMTDDERIQRRLKDYLRDFLKTSA